MKRAWIVGLIAAAVLLGLALVGYPLVRGWTGDRSMRAVAPGDTIAMDNGLTITVPAGWEGYYTQYYRIPRWVGVGEAASGLMRSDLLGIGPKSQASPRVHVTAWSHYAGTTPRRDGAPIAASPGLRAYPSPGAVFVDTSIPGREPGVIGAAHESTEGVGLLNYLWTALKVSGAEVPRQTGVPN